jgi:hypothetical protein
MVYSVVSVESRPSGIKPVKPVMSGYGCDPNSIFVLNNGLNVPWLPPGSRPWEPGGLRRPFDLDPGGQGPPQDLTGFRQQSRGGLMLATFRLNRSADNHTAVAGVRVVS